MADINDLANEVANLTTATTNLVDEVVGQKERLEDLNTQAQAQATLATTKAGEASTSAGAAASSASAANASKSGAAAEADRAELAASQATQVSGLETVEQAVSQALADGGYTWRTEADMQHERAINNAMFAASGFTYFGKHLNVAGIEEAINQGMNTAETVPNKLYMGRSNEYNPASNAVSKEAFAHINIAGFVTEIVDLNTASLGVRSAEIKFPEAEAGTRVYDSATGVSIDYAKEIDPKYGDIAPDHNEAVARAFEGEVKNGDLRFGDNGNWEQHLGSTVTIENGIISANASDTSNSLTKQTGLQFSAGVKYKVVIKDVLANQGFTLRLKGVYVASESQPPNNGEPRDYIFEIEGIDTDYFILAGGGAYSSISFSEISITKITSEVVTNRVDMFGFEGFLEQITPTNPFVYKHGLIQSQAADIDGIAVTASNRPDSYYAVYDGDTSSRGKGVNFLALSTIEQDQIANNPKNHIYRMANGDIVQWRIRQRTFAGAGNRDWQFIDSAKPVPNPLCYQSVASSHAVVQWQGEFDTPKDSGFSYSFRPKSYLNNTGKTFDGVYTALNYGTGKECYFLVCGTVSRLNQGAYHPSLNPLGTGQLAGSSNGETITGSSAWYSSTASNLTDMKYCFTKATVGDVFFGTNDGGRLYGYIGNVSGRPDGRYYDAVYASGLGGVIDYRLSAWDKSSIEAKADTLNAVKAGNYRGLEKLRRSKIYDLPTTVTEIKANGTSIVLTDPQVNLIAKYGFILDRDEWTLTQYKAIAETVSLPSRTVKINRQFEIHNLTTGKTFWIGANYADASGGAHMAWSIAPAPYIDAVVGMSDFFTVGDQVQIVEVDFTDVNLSVSGDFMQTDVIGQPESIMQCEALKDGWLGSWVPVLPTNASKLFSATRKRFDDYNASLFTTDNGLTWSTSSYWSGAFDSVKNGVSDPTLVNMIRVYSYVAYAKQTKAGKNRTVSRGIDGISDVYVPLSFDLSKLRESLIGGVNIYSGNSTYQFELPMTKKSLTTGMILQSYGDSRTSTHVDTLNELPSNLASIVKVMPYQITMNNQATLNFVANELRYDNVAQDYGDDAVLKIASNGLFTDLNGNLCKSDTHELAIPYGWVKNEI